MTVKKALEIAREELKEKEYILNVVSVDANNITPQKKYDLITFIKNAKSILFDNINSNYNTNDNIYKKNNNRSINIKR